MECYCEHCSLLSSRQCKVPVHTKPHQCSTTSISGELLVRKFNVACWIPEEPDSRLKFCTIIAIYEGIYEGTCSNTTVKSERRFGPVWTFIKLDKMSLT